VEYKFIAPLSIKEYIFSVCFLQAAKLDPQKSVTFLYLGHYYLRVGGDGVRARKCYQKAFDLDPGCGEAGEPLCDLLVEQGEEEKVHDILTAFTSKTAPGR